MAEIHAAFSAVVHHAHGQAALLQAQLREGFAAMRRRLHIPPYTTDAHRGISLPRRFVCPECGGRLAVEVQEWHEETGCATPTGYYVHCVDEDAALHELWQREASREEERDVEHRYWQSDWQPLQNSVGRWLRRNVRVR